MLRGQKCYLWKQLPVSLCVPMHPLLLPQILRYLHLSARPGPTPHARPTQHTRAHTHEQARLKERMRTREEAQGGPSSHDRIGDIPLLD